RAVEVDRLVREPRDLDGLRRSLVGAEAAGEHESSAGSKAPRDPLDRDADADDPIEPRERAPRAGLRGRDAHHHGRLIGASCLAQGRGRFGFWREVDRVDDRAATDAAVAQGSRVESVAVDDVVVGLGDHREYPRVRLVEGCDVASRTARLDERVGQAGGVDVRLDDASAWERRARGRVDVDRVPAFGHPHREVSDEHLRSALLRLGDRGDERRDERDPQPPEPGADRGRGRLCHQAGAFSLDAAAARAPSQSFLNWTMPLSVSGWWTICWRTLKGKVAMCAPASAACVTWSGLRIDAARTSDSISWIAN